MSILTLNGLKLKFALGGSIPSDSPSYICTPTIPHSICTSLHQCTACVYRPLRYHVHTYPPPSIIICNLTFVTGHMIIIHIETLLHRYNTYIKTRSCLAWQACTVILKLPPKLFILDRTLVCYESLRNPEFLPSPMFDVHVTMHKPC